MTLYLLIDFTQEIIDGSFNLWSDSLMSYRQMGQQWE